MLQIFIDLKKAYDSVGREVLCNILIQFGFLLEMVRLIKLCLNETYSRVTVGKYLCEFFPMRNGLKNRICFIDIPFQVYFRIRHQVGSGKPGWLKIKW